MRKTHCAWVCVCGIFFSLSSAWFFSLLPLVSFSCFECKSMQDEVGGPRAPDSLAHCPLPHRAAEGSDGRCLVVRVSSWLYLHSMIL